MSQLTPAEGQRSIPRLTDYAFRSHDKLRYADTDRLGHVNNAVFATFFETGRVEMLSESMKTLTDLNLLPVVARIAIDFRAEILWPGEIASGTRVAAIGNSSMTLEQSLFQDDRWVASAESIIVVMNQATRRSHPIPDTMRAFLDRLKASPPG